jgi:phage terminase large subunit-like protein
MPYLDGTLMGVQEPRLWLRPPEVASAAQDCIELYEACGQRLDPWQERCLSIGCGERHDGEWAAFEVGVICQRQNGKGGVIEAVCLASLYVWGNRVTIYSAHRGDTARATFRRVRALIENTPDLARRTRPIHDSDEVITLVGGARLEFRTRSGSGGRGLTCDLLILDEALELDADQIAAIVPTMIARPGAQVWYFSTVPASADQHLVSVRARVKAGDAELAWAEWGAEEGDSSEDPQALRAANPALGYRITMEKLASLRKILGEVNFRAECMGIWPKAGKGLGLDARVWAALADVGSHRAAGAELVLCWDWSPLRDYASIGMWSTREDEREHVQLVDYRPDTGWTLQRLVELGEVLDPVLYVVERANGGHDLVDDLPFEVAAAGAKELVRGQILVLNSWEASTAVGQFINLCRGDPGRLRHLDQEALNLAVPNVRTRPVGDAGQLALGRKISTVDVSPFAAVAYARYGGAQWAIKKPKKKAKAFIV